MELAWKTAKEYLKEEKLGGLDGPKTVIQEAFANGLIDDADGWSQILNDRNLTSHIYDQTEAEEIFERIKTKHIELLTQLLKTLQSKIS